MPAFIASFFFLLAAFASSTALGVASPSRSCKGFAPPSADDFIAERRAPADGRHHEPQPEHWQLFCVFDLDASGLPICNDHSRATHHLARHLADRLLALPQGHSLVHPATCLCHQHFRGGYDATGNDCGSNDGLACDGSGDAKYTLAARSLYC